MEERMTSKNKTQVLHHAWSSKEKIVSPCKRRITEALSFRIILTVIALFLARLGNAIPIPTINHTYLSAMFQKVDFLELINRFSGGAFGNMSIFALGITVYISASIIMQLLTIVIRRLEELEHNGAYGKKQMDKLTIYLSVFMSILMSVGLSVGFKRAGILGANNNLYVVMTAGFLCLGSLILIGLGKLIEKKGIGNGISLILMINILSSLPQDIKIIYSSYIKGHHIGVIVATIGIIVLLILLSILLNTIEKREHLQYSRSPIVNEETKQGSYLAIGSKLLSIMPVIFISSIFQFILLICNIKHITKGIYPYLVTTNWFDPKHMQYTIGFIGYVALMIFFAFFYMSINFNTIKITHEFKKQGITIENKRPGEETRKELNHAVHQIIAIGTVLLLCIVTIPMIVTGITNNHALSFTGTSIVIVVGVLLETVMTWKAEFRTNQYYTKRFLAKEGK